MKTIEAWIIVDRETSEPIVSAALYYYLRTTRACASRTRRIARCPHEVVRRCTITIEGLGEAVQA